MFTGRSEFRLTLRADNADLRLTDKGYDIGCVLKERFEKFNHFKNRYNEGIAYLKSVSQSSVFWKTKYPILPFGMDNPRKKSLFEILRFDESDLRMFEEFIESKYSYLVADKTIMTRVKRQSIYDSDELKQYDEIDEIRRNESVCLPINFDYEKLNISNEAKEKLRVAKPTSLGALSRIPGMPPVAVFKVFNYLKYNKISNIYK